MGDLLSLQRAFAAALAGRDIDEADMSMLEGTPDRVRARVGVYRGNVQANAVKALVNAYPVVAKLVGDEFMRGMARAYVTTTSSTSGDLNEYGGTFARFIATFAPAAELPYLSDVARLDWRVHRAHYAADAGPLDVAKVAAIPGERQPEIRFVLHPACSIVESRWPLARLWQIHQRDYDGAFDVDWDADGGTVLVNRPHWRVRASAIDAAGAAFLSACGDGASLEGALDRARRFDERFELDARLVQWIDTRVIVACALP